MTWTTSHRSRWISSCWRKQGRPAPRVGMGVRGGCRGGCGVYCARRVAVRARVARLLVWIPQRWRAVTTPSGGRGHVASQQLQGIWRLSRNTGLAKPRKPPRARPARLARYRKARTAMRSLAARPPRCSGCLQSIKIGRGTARTFSGEAAWARCPHTKCERCCERSNPMTASHGSAASSLVSHCTWAQAATWSLSYRSPTRPPTWCISAAA